MLFLMPLYTCSRGKFYSWAAATAADAASPPATVVSSTAPIFIVLLAAIYTAGVADSIPTAVCFVVFIKHGLAFLRGTINKNSNP